MTRLKSPALASAGIACLILLLLCCGCSGNYNISYKDGNLSVSNESAKTGCYAGHTNCSFHCADLLTDDFNCGECGKMCVGWGMACQAGNCSCKPGMTECSGQCTDLEKDSFNCGACGHSCQAGFSCVNGTCGCGKNDLNGDRRIICHGSCTDISVDSDNCGACGRRCFGGKTCLFGVCQNR
jgi:hypothetical protein